MAAVDPWQLEDPLGRALHLLRMDGAFYCRSELSAPWGMTLPTMPDYLWFHVVTRGSMSIEVPGDEPLRLEPGDLAVVSRGAGHRLVSEPGVAAPGILDLQRTAVSDRYEILRHGAGGAPTTLVCGAVRFDDPAARRLVDALPPTIHIAAGQTEWMQGTLRLMAAEARELRPGGESVITRLGDILVIQALREWLDSDPSAGTGWLAALQDPQIGRALTLIHEAPARAWTVEALAGEVAMSRSAFAARFSELVGEPVMRYVARWRMHVAMAALRDGDATVAQLADRLGYQSEAAFSRAFKRITGMAPGAARRQQPGGVLAAV